MPTGAEAHTDSPQQSVITATQHVLVCCLQELGGIVKSLSTTATQLTGDSQTGKCLPFIQVGLSQTGRSLTLSQKVSNNQHSVLLWQPEYQLANI